MNRASSPPATKKNMVPTPYMMPIFLWSTVVIHDRQPVVVFGRVKTPSAPWAVAGVTPGKANGAGRFSSIAVIGNQPFRDLYLSVCR